MLFERITNRVFCGKLGWSRNANYDSCGANTSYGQEQRDHLGITNQLVRVSAGLEDKEDLLADLRQAVEGAKR